MIDTPKALGPGSDSDVFAHNLTKIAILTA